MNFTTPVISLPSDPPVITYDGLPVTAFRMIFPKLPMITMFLHSMNMPSITIGEVVQSSRYVDINQIGEKIRYSPFEVTFMVDKYLHSLNEVHEWMKRMSVSGSNVGEVDNPYLLIGSKSRIKFINAWPSSISNISFRTNTDQVEYIEATATFNYDYMEIEL